MLWFFRFSCLMLVYTLITSSNATAETQVFAQGTNLRDQDSTFVKYLNSYEIAQALYNNAVQINNKMSFICTAKYNISIGDIKIIEPVTFNDTSRNPQDGIWGHNYTISRCGRDIAYNVYFVAKQGQAPQVVSGPLGHTELSLKDIIELTPMVYKAALTRLGPSCGNQAFSDSALTSDSKVLVQPNEQQGTRSWQEEWHVLACNRTVIVEIALDEDLATHKVSYSIKESKLPK